jgi:hypothetical protein
MIESMKNPNDLIGNQTHDLSTCPWYKVPYILKDCYVFFHIVSNLLCTVNFEIFWLRKRQIKRKRKRFCNCGALYTVKCPDVKWICSIFQTRGERLMHCARYLRRAVTGKGKQSAYFFLTSHKELRNFSAGDTHRHTQCKVKCIHTSEI